MNTQQRLIARLEDLSDRLVRRTLELIAGSREGYVMTVGPPPYRRVDCDGRALAYVRVRPRKRAVRVDISGLWRAEGLSRLKTSSATGAGTLLLKGIEDTEDAAAYLAACVRTTRETEDWQKRKPPPPRLKSVA